MDGVPADGAAGEGPKDGPKDAPFGRSGSYITPDRRPTRFEGSCVVARCCPGSDRPLVCLGVSLTGTFSERQAASLVIRGGRVGFAISAHL